MSEIHADGGPIPIIPDDITIPQFILDVHHPARPVLKTPQPWCIDELSGREVGSDEVSTLPSKSDGLEARVIACGEGRQHGTRGVELTARDVAHTTN